MRSHRDQCCRPRARIARTADIALRADALRATAEEQYCASRGARWAGHALRAHRSHVHRGHRPQRPHGRAAVRGECGRAARECRGGAGRGSRDRRTAANSARARMARSRRTRRAGRHAVRGSAGGLRRRRAAQRERATAAATQPDILSAGNAGRAGVRPCTPCRTHAHGSPVLRDALVSSRAVSSLRRPNRHRPGRAHLLASLVDVVLLTRRELRTTHRQRAVSDARRARFRATDGLCRRRWSRRGLVAPLDAARTHGRSRGADGPAGRKRQREALATSRIAPRLGQRRGRRRARSSRYVARARAWREGVRLAAHAEGGWPAARVGDQLSVLRSGPSRIRGRHYDRAHARRCECVARCGGLHADASTGHSARSARGVAATPAGATMVLVGARHCPRSRRRAAHAPERATTNGASLRKTPARSRRDTR